MATILLRNGDNPFTVAQGTTNTQVFNGPGAQTLNIGVGSDVDLTGFQDDAGDTVKLGGQSGDYQVSRSGSTVTLENTNNNTTITVTAGSNANGIQFSDTTIDLSVNTDTGDVEFGSQTVTETAEAVTAAGDGTGHGGSGVPGGGGTGGGGTGDGQTFTLTQSTDTLTPNTNVEQNRTTDGDDLVRGPLEGSNRTLNDADLIDAAGGTDELEATTNVTSTLASAPSGGVQPELASVENIFMSTAAPADSDFSSTATGKNDAQGVDVQDADGFEQLWGVDLDEDLSYANIDTTDVTIGLKDTDRDNNSEGGGVIAGFNAATLSGGSDTIDVALDNNIEPDPNASGTADAGGVIVISEGTGVDAGAETLSVNVSGDNRIQRLSSLDNNTDTTLETVNITGGSSLTVVDRLDFEGGSGTIDASNASASVSLTAGTVDDENITFTGSSGSNTLTTGGGDDDLTGGSSADLFTLGGGDDIVNANAGNDRVNLEGTLTGDDSVSGGAGNEDVVGDTAANLDALQGDSAALNALSGFEGVAVEDDGTAANDGLQGQTLDLDNFGTAGNLVILEGSENTGTFDSLSSGATVRRTDAAADTSAGTGDNVDLNVPGATQAGTPNDTVNFEFSQSLMNTAQGSDMATALDVGRYSVSGINNINIAATDTRIDALATDGSEGVSLVLDDGSQVSTVDASESTAGVSVDGGAGNADLGGSEGIEMTGGSGRDFLTGSDDGDIIDGGDNTAVINDLRDNEELDGKQGDDQIDAGGGWTFVQGGQGADDIDLGSGEADGAAASDVNDSFDGLQIGDALDFATQDTDAVWFDAKNELFTGQTANTSGDSSNFNAEVANVDQVSNFNQDQDTVAVTGGTSTGGEAAILDTGSANTSVINNGAQANDGSGNAQGATGTESIYQIALDRGDATNESTLGSDADNLLDEAAVIEELSKANGNASGNTSTVLVDGSGEFSAEDEVVFTVFGPEDAFATFAFDDTSSTGDDDDQIEAGDLQLVAVGSSGNVSDTFDAIN